MIPINSSKEELLVEIDRLNARIIELEKSEASENQKFKKKYNDLFEKSEDAFLIIQNGKFVDCNSATIKMLKYNTKTEFLNTHPSVLSPEMQPDGKTSFEKADEMMALAFKNGSHRFEWDHKKSDGEIFPVEVLLTVIENSDENQILHTVWRDISERKKSENELKQSEARFKQLFNNLGDAVFVTKIGGKERGRIIELNTAAIEQTGYSKQELLQMNIIKDLCVAGTGHISTEDWEEKLLSGKTVQTSEKKRRKDGTEFWTEVIVTAFEFKGEIASISINRDITNQKIAEDALKESEEHFRAMFENTSIGFYRTTPEGKILYANPALLSILKYNSFEELAKRNLKTHSFDINISRADILKLIDSKGFMKGYESTWKVNDDSIIYIRENTKAFSDKEGKVLYYEGTIEDITEKKEAELLLKESEAKYRTLIDNIQEGVFMLDAGKIIFANKSFAKIIGYREDEVLGQKFSRFVAPEHVEMIENYYLNGLKGDSGPREYEFKALHKDGQSLIDVRVVADIILYEKKPVALGTVKDISENKKILEQLELREKYYRRLFDLSPSGIIVLDLNGTILDVNESFCNNTGYSIQELKNSNIRLLTPQDRHSEIDLSIHEMLKEKIIRKEVINISKDGTRRNVELHETKVTLPDGKPGILSIANDITERTRAAQIQSVIYNISAAVNLTQNLDELLSIIRDGLGTIIDTTNFFVAIYDEDSDTIFLPYIVDQKDSHTSFPAGKSFTAHVIRTKKPLLATKKVMHEMIASGKVEAFGTLSKIWLGVPMILKGKVTGAIVVQSYTNENAYNYHDLEILEFVSQAISNSIDRKRAEQDLIKALEKATESDRLKSAFLATISHELRTPLNAIIGFSDIIETDTPLDDILGFVKTINSSGKHLLGIVEDIFDITLIEKGNIELKKTKEDLSIILKNIDEIIEIEQQNTNKTHIKIKQRIPDLGKEIVINTDTSKLKQILINLLKNALKFTLEGFINYGYEFVMINKQPYLKFFVIDSGIGIAKDKQSIIFDMFRQVEDSHTRIYGGTGIGLSISKKLTELLGGKLWVDSEENKGSSFYFTIPLESNPENLEIINTSIENDNPPDIFDNKVVLIVEDDLPSFEFLRIVLSARGIKCVWAKNGEEAINYCAENAETDLILMDLNMPIMNGYEATIKIKEINPTIPVIAQTAYAIAGDKEKALAAGCNDYISKPIKKSALFELIAKYLK